MTVAGLAPHPEAHAASSKPMLWALFVFLVCLLLCFLSIDELID
jgi:hypothetical protein